MKKEDEPKTPTDFIDQYKKKNTNLKEIFDNLN